ncbi:MAG TPA: class I SAM-dependent methyltransferase [Gammaproteobacteria bacterium]|nr:class I SAM-dependent methyltransferase [Gammaproteobacteria bacterium]|tara:strand:- start:3005 stop:3745 length:741 start_codon:yes stop_codon:yes gene_type:complete
MTTNYDYIADKYKESKLEGWRTYIEQYTLLQILGDISGKSALDYACGEGHYTRVLRRLGAESVLGVDLSQSMIDLAKAEESRSPLGIRYLQGDARFTALTESSDIVFAAYLLNYAKSPQELLEMAQAVSSNLRSGGRFVSVNNNPDDPPSNFLVGRPYGFTKHLEGHLVEGAPIVFRFHLSEGSFDVTNYHMEKATVEAALFESGLREIRWHEPAVSPEGLRLKKAEHWAPFLARPPVAFFECTKL